MKKRFVFGPVLSRRLGRSLGIDLLPFKTCNFNCVYCELGNGIPRNKRDYFFPLDHIITEIQDYLKNNPELDYITFSGSGEPTLSKNIGDVIKFLKENYSYKVALLTNSTLLNDPEVLEAITPIDLLVPSLDAALQTTFLKINRPSYKFNFNINSIIEGIKKARERIKGETWLEVFIVPGINDDEKNLKALKEAIEYINPHRLQINTVDRPPAENWVRPLNDEEKKRIEQFLGRNFIEVEENVKEPEELEINNLDEIKEMILNTLALRPQSIEHLAKALKVKREIINQIISNLRSQNLIKEYFFNGKIYLSLNDKKR